MSTVPQTSKHQTASDDAPRADRAAHAHSDAPAAKPAMKAQPPLDAPLDDPYDNVACTD
jgi:hypothetical protein